MNHPPTIETERLILRPFQISDAARVKELAGAYEIYRPTLNIPHPYEDGMAERWISTHAAQFYSGEGVNLAVTLKGDGLLIGAIGLGASPKHNRAELGYWIGVPYWGNGYCTEAAIAVIRYGFGALKLHKITCSHMEWNTASGRVMQKAGMQREGVLTDHLVKDGEYRTMVLYGILNGEEGSAAEGHSGST
ncbi:MAG: GNAT family N-acetyltransferase [Dehalococcoidia bacterium]